MFNFRYLRSLFNLNPFRLTCAIIGACSIVACSDAAIKTAENLNADGVETQAEASLDEVSVDKVTYFMPEFTNWRSELISFPLEFAPSVNYEGHEDVRFAPGMFTQDAPDYWSYTFLWWLDANQSLNADKLNIDFNAYFTGLADLVAGQDGKDHMAITDFNRSNPFDFTGRANVFDAFAAQAHINLNIRVKIVECPNQQKRAVFFALSPQGVDHAIWGELDRVREEFSCVQP